MRCVSISAGRVGGNLPQIAPGIAKHCTAVSVWQVGRNLQRERIGRNSTLVGRIGIAHVNVQKCAAVFAQPGSPTHHDDRIADRDYGRTIVVVLASGRKNRSEKLDQCCRIGRDEARRHRRPTFGPPVLPGPGTAS